MKPILVIAFLLLMLKVQAQSAQTLDSLKTELQKAKADTTRMRLMQLLGKGYLRTGNTESMELFRNGLALAEKNGSSRWKQEFTLYIGINQSLIHRVDSSLYYLEKCRQMKDNETTEEIIYETYYYLGQSYFSKGNTKDAITFLIESLKHASEPNSQRKKASTYTILSNLMSQLNEIPKALDYSLLAIECVKENQDSGKLSTLYSGLSGIYYELGKKDSALLSIRKAVTIAENLANPKPLIYAYVNLITFYNYINESDSAESYFKKVKKLYEEYGRIDESYSFLILQMAETAYKKKQFEKAEQLYNEADSLTETNAFHVQLLQVKKQKAGFYENSGNWKAAVRTYKEYYYLKDSVESKEKAAATLELEKKYSVSQKEKEIALLQKEKEKQELTNKAYIAVASLAGLIGLILFFGFRNRGRLNKQLAEKNKIIDAERERAIRSEQFKQQFLANMSHELRSPMNAVLGGVSLALQQKDIQSGKKYLETAQRSSKNLLGIINDILDLSKIESGKLSLEQIPFNLFDTTQDVINAQAINLKNEKQQLHFETTIDKNINVKADPLRYMQVLTNLINNAIKFTPTGNIIVSLNHNLSKKVFEITVKDEGIGMSEDQIQNLFQTYNQTAKSIARKYGGTGLGLAITRQLVDLMNGTINVMSKPNQGTTFTVVIPFEITDEQFDADEITNEHHSQLKKLQNVNLILADDLEENRMITHDVLKSVLTGANIKSFSNGKEMIDYLQTQPDLSDTCILTDLDMPVMNGFEAVNIIRKQLNLDVPVVALTASVFIGEEEEFKSMGFDEIVIKPFVTSRLIAAIAKALQSKQGLS